jgi:hypothetical protein
MSSVCGEAPAVMSSGEQLTHFKIGPHPKLPHIPTKTDGSKSGEEGSGVWVSGYKVFFTNFLKSYVYNNFLIFSFYKQDKDLFYIQQPT